MNETLPSECRHQGRPGTVAVNVFEEPAGVTVLVAVTVVAALLIVCIKAPRLPANLASL